MEKPPIEKIRFKKLKKDEDSQRESSWKKRVNKKIFSCHYNKKNSEINLRVFYKKRNN
jgi:hypothetical protein